MKRLCLVLVAALLLGCSPTVSGVPIDWQILCVEVSGRRSPELVAPVQKVMEERIRPYVLWKPGYARHIRVVDTGCGPEHLLLNLAPDEPTDPAHLEERLLRLYGVVDDSGPRPVNPKSVKSPMRGFATTSLWSVDADTHLAAGRAPGDGGFVMLLHTDGTYKLLGLPNGPAFIKRVKGDHLLLEYWNQYWLMDLTTLNLTPADENGNPTT